MDPLLSNNQLLHYYLQNKISDILPLFSILKNIDYIVSGQGLIPDHK